MDRIIRRDEQQFENTWATEDLFRNDEAWETAFSEMMPKTAKIKEFEGKLGISGKNIYDYMILKEAIKADAMRIYCYAMLKNDEDSAVSKYQGYYGRAVAMFSEINAMSAFANPELIAIPDKTLEGFYIDCPELQVFKHYLDIVRMYREHTLSPESEEILAAAGEIASSPETIASVFRDADLKFPDIFDSNGNKLQLTSGTYIQHMENKDRTVRRQAFGAMYETYGKFKNTIASTLNAQVRQLCFYTKTRRFKSNLEKSLFDNEVPVDVYKNLITAVNENLPALHKYARLRKKALGVDELHMYDMYVPLLPDEDIKIGYEEAKKLCTESLSVLGPDYLKILNEGFENRWIDVYENEGKRSGAYSMGANPHPFVLLNHKETLDSAFTLTHEMGHAIHSYLSKKNQRETYSSYVIFVAEVASTFNEALLTKHLLATTDDRKKRAFIINHLLEQFRGTIYRQTMFAEFELKMSELSESGETLTAETLCGIYHDLNKKYYGPDVVADDEIAVEWARIPHFFYDFYVYQYATGFAAAIALSDKVVSEGESSVKDYISFLSSGCTSDPITLLKKAGVDMATPDPVNQALKMFDSLVDEMEQLLR